MCSNPIFVVGYMHSGTTMLVNILGEHPDVWRVKGETRFFSHAPLYRLRYPNLENDDTLRDLIHTLASGIKWSGADMVRDETGIKRDQLDAIFDSVKLTREYATVFRAVFDHMSRSAGCARWTEKTPTHIFHISEILEAIPDAYFVEIVRDPRDVLASKKTRRASIWTTERYTSTQRPMKALALAYDPFWDYSVVEIGHSSGTEST
ncbi:MAG: sulfotransferase [Anaerolineae bacterium]|nr:sulfotransferase [Anaerolineae bacterium]